MKNSAVSAVAVLGLAAMGAYTAMYLLAVSPFIAHAIGHAMGW